VHDLRIPKLKISAVNAPAKILVVLMSSRISLA